MEDLVNNFQQYLIDQKCKDIAVFKTTICGKPSSVFLVSTASAIENKKLADRIMKDFSFDSVPEGYNKGEWIVFDFDDIIINSFIPSVREKFNLEKLWQKEKVENILKEQAPMKKRAKSSKK